MKNRKEIVCFDTETTGLIKPSVNNLCDQPYITEIYMGKFSECGELIGEFESFVKPKVKITKEITKITGITNEDVEYSPSFVEIFDKMAEFMTGVSILSAHNLAFDRNMLANEMLRCDKVLNFPWPLEHICTVRASKHLEGHRMALMALHEYLFNEPFSGAHRAKTDVIAQSRCFFELVSRGDIKL